VASTPGASVAVPDATSPAPGAALESGAPAPTFEIPAAVGGTFDMGAVHNRPVLLSFLHSQADSDSPAASESRSQVVFLRSMQQQYQGQGLVVAIVDATALETGQQPGEDALINVVYDWQLDSSGVALGVDVGSQLARLYGVRRAPTTFLIGADKKIVERWEGFTSASQLAFALNDLVGTPALK
jgi:hypothetical protein